MRCLFVRAEPLEPDLAPELALLESFSGEEPDFVDQLIALGEQFSHCELVAVVSDPSDYLQSNVLLVKGRSVTRHALRLREVTGAIVPVTANPKLLTGLFRAGSTRALEATKRDGVKVPPQWHDLKLLSAAMDALSTMVAGPISFCVGIRDYGFNVQLDPVKGVRIDPVLRTVGDARIDAMLARVLEDRRPTFDYGIFVPAKFARPRRNKHQPYTTGEARTRLKAIPHKPGPEDIQHLLEAIIDPANAGPFYEDVRVKLYSAISYIETDEVRATFRYALRTESDAAARFISTIVWRQKPVFDLWAADLVEAWNTDRRYADRILFAFAEAYFRPAASVLKGASPALLAALVPEG